MATKDENEFQSWAEISIKRIGFGRRTRYGAGSLPKERGNLMLMF
jgi:hypothetical protein